MIARLLRGQGCRAGYARLLRGLLPAYQALEAGLERHGTTPWLSPLARPGLYRSAALAADLAALERSYGRAPELPAAGPYAAAVTAAAATGDGAGLIAHAYVRYLGDLSGGVILSRVLTRSLGLPPEMLAFYRFPAIPDLAACKAELLAAIDEAGRTIARPERLLEEARRAFSCNIALSLEAAEHLSVPG